jgi:hypothetical protein
MSSVKILIIFLFFYYLNINLVIEFYKVYRRIITNIKKLGGINYGK